MRRNQNNNNNKNNKAKHDNTSTNGFLPNSFRLISSCIKTVSSNVRYAGASVAGSISGESDDHHKDQVLWASFDRLELNSSVIKTVLLLGYLNGFQVLDVEDASNITELVSRRDDAVTFLQMQPIPAKHDDHGGFIDSHPLLLVMASEETKGSGPMRNARDGSLRDNDLESHVGAVIQSPTAVRFYSLRTHSYIHVLRFRSAVYMVRCSSKIVAVGLASQIYCFDALTLENKFSVLTYPVPQLGGQGLNGVSIGYGPMAVGPRWLAYASSNPLLSNTGRLSPKSLSPSPGVSPSTSPGNGNLVARYAMESSKQLATGLINLGDVGYKTFSKYCHELLPDGSSSPVSVNSSWKVGWAAAHSSDMDTAGTVVIKDYVSREVVSQFRAHTSPISALCFDPSGTLLVTASIHGTNINIFRIMPSYVRNGSGTRVYDWSTSHVHLYKLHRGMTSAVIQDICFSHYSQWVAIVSSRGTGHVFVLSPFGGETGLQMQNSYLNGPNLLPVLSAPWWSTSSFMIQRSYSPLPPLPITLSVVSRIKNSGWLNTVSNAASSAAGKPSVPSGVVAAVFHSSAGQNLQHNPLQVNALEHLMVYTPSGNVIQYELLPHLGGDQGESSSRSGTKSLGQGQEEDLKVKVGPVQWWDVCRRADWPEREEFVGGSIPGRQDAAETVRGTSDYEDDDIKARNMVKHHDQPLWYLSNAEVQIRSGRRPVWQKSQVYFHTLSSVALEGERQSLQNNTGEVEIEKLPAPEIEIRRKGLLPVFDHFHKIHPEWANSRSLSSGRYSPSSYSDEGKDKHSEEAYSHAKLVSPGLVDNANTGSPRAPPGLPKEEYSTTLNSYPSFSPTYNVNNGADGPSSAIKQSTANGADTLFSPDQSSTIITALEEDYVTNYSYYPKKASPSEGNIAQEVLSSSSVVTGDVSNTSSNRSDLSMNILEEEIVHEDMHDQLDFVQDFQEGYCKSTNNDGCNELADLVPDVDSSTSHGNKANSEKEEDSDDMLGGVFAFSKGM